MTISDIARNQAISLEAKKDALAQRQNGDWKVSFTVQSIDMDPRLTLAAMGTRFAMVLVEIGDDELPVEKEGRAEPRQDRQPQPDGAKRMDWREVQPAAQAGIRCNDAAFRTFLAEEHSFRPRKDEDELGQATDFLRNMLGISSRAELSTDHRKRVLWHQLDSQFQAWKALEHA